MSEGDHDVRLRRPEGPAQLGGGEEQGKGLTGAAEFMDLDGLRQESAEGPAPPEDEAEGTDAQVGKPSGEVHRDALKPADLKVGAEDEGPGKCRSFRSVSSFWP